MAWDDKEKKDPWGARNKKTAPPDLDQLIKKFFRALLGGGRTPSVTGKSAGHSWRSGVAVFAVIAVLVIVWFLSGIYVVGPAEEAVVLRFGNYVETQSSGIHWIPQFIESRTIVNVQAVHNFGYQSDMLTKDENIVSVEVAVQYRVANPFEYLYNVTDPLQSLQQATASALRQVVGNTNLDNILTTERQLITEKMQTELVTILVRYKTGLVVEQVTLQSTKPPEEVTDAFNDAIKAREDEQRYQNQAFAYASDVVPIAKGGAKRMLAEAGAYQQQVVLDAQAHVAAFNALLPEYKKFPHIMRERLYLDAMESVFNKTSKVLLTQSGDHPVVYLPLNDIMTQKMPSPVAAQSALDEAAPPITATSTVATTSALPLYPNGYFSTEGSHS